MKFPVAVVKLLKLHDVKTAKIGPNPEQLNNPEKLTVVAAAPTAVNCEVIAVIPLADQEVNDANTGENVANDPVIDDILREVTLAQVGANDNIVVKLASDNVLRDAIVPLICVHVIKDDKFNEVKDERVNDILVAFVTLDKFNDVKELDANVNGFLMFINALKSILVNELAVTDNPLNNVVIKGTDKLVNPVDVI